MHTTTHRIGIQWILGAAALLAAAGVQASCFTVYNARGHMVQRSAETPVNMAYQLHQTVPYAYGQGSTMVFGSADPDCGAALDPYYDLKTAQVVYDEPTKATRQAKGKRQHVRKARRSQP